MTILERLKEAENEIKALLQDLEEERKKNRHLRDCYDIQNKSFTEKVQRLQDLLNCRNERCDALEMTAARLQNELNFERTKVAKLEKENSALRRDLIVSRTETKNLQELYEEQVRYTASMCKRLQSGKDWWIVERGDFAPAVYSFHAAAKRMADENRYNAPIHVREVVNVDTGTIDMGTGMRDANLQLPSSPPLWVPVAVTADGKVEDVKHFNRTLTPEEVKEEYEHSSYGIRSVTQWPVSPEPLWTPFTDLADGWFHIDAIQIIDYDWRYAGWTDGKRRYGPICCTWPLTTFDTVVIRDEWGNDLLTWEGMQKHCNEIEKRLEETDANRAEAWTRYGEVCRTNVALETRLAHAMALLRDISEIFKKGWHPSIELQVRVKALVAKYAESPLDVPNPQGEQLKKAMELLEWARRRTKYRYKESHQIWIEPQWEDEVKALIEKYGEGGDDE